ncbi:hypothetical protein G5V59_24160 [Nocardioides sp. W3-2-3]|uniref:hypothetical protein n=1 Tax=Nocardioides convexus TaxID=2712224 RepID=UPI002418ADE5|nr:hypothetical protein [Nocardioides convexus]NHA01752.1 hypothetical protein [Nocardioides convexus]
MAGSGVAPYCCAGGSRSGRRGGVAPGRGCTGIRRVGSGSSPRGEREEEEPVPEPEP